MKWIKLSERKPDMNKTILAKMSGEPIIGYYSTYFRPESFEYSNVPHHGEIFSENFHLIEWLDESDDVSRTVK